MTKDYTYILNYTGALTAAVDLDRERVDTYHLIAKAVDSGSKSCTMDITINLSDVNDNSPVFAPVQGPIPISEGAAINTLVYRVFASDADYGMLNGLYYNLWYLTCK